MKHFAFAARELEKAGVKIAQKSRIFRTSPVDCPPGTPDFSNAVWRCEYAEPPQELLAITQAVEVASGRPARHGFHTPRTLDLDIIDFDGISLQTDTLTLPHPRAARRDFVTTPLREVLPPGAPFPAIS